MEDDEDDEADEGDEGEVSVFSLVEVKFVESNVEEVNVDEVLGEASWQHSKNAGSHGIPKENLWKEHPWPMDPVRMPNLQASQQSR